MVENETSNGSNLIGLNEELQRMTVGKQNWV